MGEYAKRLHRKLAQQAHNLPTEEPKRRAGELLPGGAKGLPTLIKEGLDPIHAVYVLMHNLAAQFAETVAHFPEMKKWTQVVEKAEEEYMPSGPPMSPLTGSYFWMWALYDLRIGKSTDTMAHCLIASNDVILMNPHQLEAAKQLEASRMGIYEHIGREGRYIRLRELIVNHQLICYCPTGYAGRKGELWYVRLLPPLEPELGTFWVAMTTPYILIETSKTDWIAFLKRTMVHCEGPNEATRLHYLMKFGLEPNYWNEFVFKGYCNYQQDAVFLTGVPDIESSLPHA